ncbi:GTP-binding protein TypA [Coprinopsis sp. MPI-PUGE-AT-0042]|nr:GTP-binding protein TypA [Coprinopsis sp. MPI-PUGE-AT-0042]
MTQNIAVIAHVDQGKTTLVDQLLRQSGTLGSPSPSSTSSTSPSPSSSNEGEEHVTRLMDSNDLEKERGITIPSKRTSTSYTPPDAPTPDNPYHITIIDTPGHADFGGEVERVLSMVDGVALIVDATEGPMTQTRFVLSMALALGLRPLVVLNKADRPSAQVEGKREQVELDLIDLFVKLGASDEQADYPVVYARAKEGWASLEPPTLGGPLNDNMNLLFDTILLHVPPPTHLDDADDPTRIQSYVGTLYLGRVHSGQLTLNTPLVALNAGGEKVGEGRVKKLYARRGLDRFEKEITGAGEIVSIAGIKGGGVNCTLTSPIDPPTISVVIYPDDSPLAGQEGSKLTSQMIRETIYKESETNVVLQVLPGPTSESLELRGRGVLHLGVLFETLRREGYELSVGPPKAVMKPDPERPGQLLEPIEEVSIFVHENYAGQVVQKLTMRKAEMISYDTDDSQEGWIKIIMHVPARGLIGYMAGEFGNDVHGQGTINHIFKGYEPFKGAIDTGRNGALISMASGESSGYAMMPLQARGTLFIGPQTMVYPGMVIGESSKSQDMYLNPTVKKQLTNIRAAGADDKIVLSSPRTMSLEENLSYMADDELVELTPGSVRLRKVTLDQTRRMRGGGKR